MTGTHVARYDEIGVPLLEPGLNATPNGPVGPGALPGTTDTIVGGAGAVPTMVDAEAGERGLVPTEFVAVTEHVYVRPLVRPVTVMGELVPVCEPVTPT